MDGPSIGARESFDPHAGVFAAFVGSVLHSADAKKEVIRFLRSGKQRTIDELEGYVRAVAALIEEEQGREEGGNQSMLHRYGLIQKGLENHIKEVTHKLEKGIR